MNKVLRASGLAGRMAMEGNISNRNINLSKGKSQAGPVYQPDNNTVLTLRITRATANIAGALPVPVFAPAHGGDLYQSFLAPFLPAGVTITAMTCYGRQETAALGLAGNLSMTLSDGVATDILTVACDNVPFLVLLAKLMGDSFTMGGLRLSVPIANIAQFDQTIFFVDRTGYGSANENNLVPSNFINEYQQQANIITISDEAVLKVGFPPVDNQRGLVVRMAPTAGLVYTISIGINSRFLQAG